MSLTIMIWVYSMSSCWVGGPANTTHSWGLELMLEMQEEEESSQEGARMVAVQLTFFFTWNIRARDGQGVESPGQEPQSYNYFQLYCEIFSIFMKYFLTEWLTLNVDS